MYRASYVVAKQCKMTNLAFSVQKLLRLATVLVGMTFVGCSPNPSGGGTQHISPETAVCGEPIELELSFSVAGKLDGPLDRRFTHVKCHYEADRIEDAGVARGVITLVTNEQMVMSFSIPTSSMAPGTEVSYSFSFLFDGHKNVREGGKVLLLAN